MLALRASCPRTLTEAGARPAAHSRLAWRERPPARSAGSFRAPGRQCTESCQCVESCPRPAQLAELEAKGKVLPSSSGDYQLVQKIAERVIKAVEAGRGGGFQDHVRKCAARWEPAGACRLQAGRAYPLHRVCVAQRGLPWRRRHRLWCLRLVGGTHSRTVWSLGADSPPAAVHGKPAVCLSVHGSGPYRALHQTHAHLPVLSPLVAGSTGRSWWWRTRRPMPSCCPAARSSCSPVRPRAPLSSSLPQCV